MESDKQSENQAPTGSDVDLSRSLFDSVKSIENLSTMGQYIYREKQSFSRLIVIQFEKIIQSFKSRTSCDCPKIEHSKQCKRIISLLRKRYDSKEDSYMNQHYHYLNGQKLNKEIKAQIAKDIERTVDKEFPSSFIMSLKNLLENMAKQWKKIGYVQGMNYIAAALLYHSEEWVAFAIMGMFFNKLDLSKLFSTNFQFLLLQLNQMSFYLQKIQPALYQHLKENDILPISYALPWYISFFTVLAPIEYTIRIFEGIQKFGVQFLHRTALAYLSSRAPALLLVQGPDLQTELGLQNYRRVQNDDWDLILEQAHNLLIK